MAHCLMFELGASGFIRASALAVGGFEHHFHQIASAEQDNFDVVVAVEPSELAGHRVARLHQLLVDEDHQIVGVNAGLGGGGIGRTESTNGGVRSSTLGTSTRPISAIVNGCFC